MRSPSVSPLSSRCSSPNLLESVDLKLLSTTVTNNDAAAFPPVVMSHRKSKSLVGFDPLLNDCEKNTTDAPKKQDVHPLLRDEAAASPSTTTTVTTMSTLSRSSRRNRGHHGHTKSLGNFVFDDNKSKKPPMAKNKRHHRKTQSLGGDLSSSIGNIMGKPAAMSRQSSVPRNIAAVSTDDTFLELPLLAKPSPTSFLPDDGVMRSSEQDPTPHQVEIPSAETFFTHAKLSALLEDSLSQDEGASAFWESLVGTPRMALQQELASMSDKKKQLVKKLLACGESIHAVAGFAECPTASVLVLDGQHQVWVVFCGKGGLQQKPVSTKQARHVSTRNNFVLQRPVDLPMTVFPAFRESYMALETQTCGILDRLTTANPFCKVLFGGHSFGAALATLGCMRFASARPALRVSCLVTACPKVGTTESLSQRAHALPNLCICRLESPPNDSNMTMVPADSATHTWSHAGHCIVLGGKKMASSSSIRAFRFDKNKPKCHHAVAGALRGTSHFNAHDYAKALQPFCNEKQKWVQGFCGENVGQGVLGKDNEQRMMV